MIIRPDRQRSLVCCSFVFLVFLLLPACVEESNGQDSPVESTSTGPSATSPVPSAPGSSLPARTPSPGPTSGPAPTTADPVSPVNDDPGVGGVPGGPEPEPAAMPTGGAPPLIDAGALPSNTSGGGAGGTPTPPDASTSGAGGGSGIPDLPDPGPEGDGDYEAGPNYGNQPELGNQGAPRGRSFRFTMSLADSEIFDGQDPTLTKPVNQTRNISVYVPDQYQDGTPAPVLVIQDGDGPLGMVSNALDNLTISDDPERRLPAFIAVAVQNGGSDAQGSERGLEYDTMSDRYARFIDEEVLPAVEANPEVRGAYPNLRFTTDPSGRAALGCSSGGAAAFTMAWFRPDLFSRVVAYSTTLVDQQDHNLPEFDTYPHGAWDYHSELELIANSEKKPVRIFLNVNENDLNANDPASTLHNWVMANERTAAALAAKDYHYRYVYGLGATHCDGRVQQGTLADALVWVWRGYEPATE